MSVDRLTLDRPALLSVGVRWHNRGMSRNPYHVALLTAGCLSLLTAAVLQFALSETSEYQPYNFTGVVGLTSWIAVLFGGAMLCFVGASVIAGISWSTRHAQVLPSASGGQDVGRTASGS